MRRLPVIASLVVCALFAAVGTGLSYSTYGKWATSPVTFFLNPNNSDVSASAAASAFQFALNVWNTQGGSSFRYQYGGTVGDTATAYDNRNVVIFRNASNGSAIGTTYSWWNSSKKLLDSDIVIWDANFTFFTGSSGCGVVSNAAYLEDIATHELGHALGLNHSTSADATMYPSYSYCSQAFRTLASDDIAGVRSLYPATAPSNTPPTVTITSPANGASFVAGTSISLAASATDAEDGNLSSSVQWTDNGASLGTGSVLSRALSLVGIHTIAAKVTDRAGAQASSQVSITITVLPSGGGGGGSTTGALSVTGSTTPDGWASADIRWSGFTSQWVDVYRNSVLIDSTSNDGSKIDVFKGTGSYTYKVCAYATTSCTNTVTVTF